MISADTALDASLPSVLQRASAEIHAIVTSLHESRAALEAVTVEPLQHTNVKLQEVTSATEVAATDILDALDRAQGMVDDLETADDTGDRARARQTRDRLREELFGMMGALQFQDITTQQLAHAANMLSTVEGRLRAIAQMFDPATPLATAAAGAFANDLPDAGRFKQGTFDPNATMHAADRRQAAADAIFSGVV